MEVVPQLFNNNSLRLELSLRNCKEYICPECEVESSDAAVKTEWVKCPIINNFICIASCINIAGDARSKQFDDQIYFSLKDFSKKIKKDVTSVRKLCLEHQLLILSKELTKETGVEKIGKLKQLSENIKSILSSLTSDA